MKYPITYAKRKNIIPEMGTRLRVKRKIEQTVSFNLAEEFLKCRKPSIVGEFAGVAGVDNVWLVKQENGEVGAYSTNELRDEN
ncbi:MAG: hypothetical protein JETCAE03_34910 [Ignavibacteriaceae bacterium]|jgi:hypothetical protein|nr:MAG: hypothetical protein JETCAE03_34910 [Ignavibacteriaceae bacterium]